MKITPEDKILISKYQEEGLKPLTISEKFNNIYTPRQISTFFYCKKNVRKIRKKKEYYKHYYKHYYQNNKEKIDKNAKVYHKNWQKENKEKVNEYKCIKRKENKLFDFLAKFNSVVDNIK